MLDTVLIYNKIRQIISDRIGPSLSTSKLKGLPDPVPSIISLSTTGTKPHYPYATMNILNITDSASYLTNKYVNTLGQDVYETYKDVLFVVGVRAGKTSYSLCNTVKRAFILEPTLTYLLDELGATVARTSDIRTGTEALTDRYQNYCTFDVVLRVKDVEVDTDSTPIEATDVTGAVIDGAGNPLNTEIITP